MKCELATLITLEGIVALYEAGFTFAINDGDIVGMEEACIKD